MKLIRIKNEIEFCMMFFRFFIDSRHQLITVLKKYHIMEQDAVENYINWELLSNFQFFLFIIYNLGVYDESNDKVLYFQTLLVIFCVL